jgi:hypothetical protein
LWREAQWLARVTGVGLVHRGRFFAYIDVKIPHSIANINAVIATFDTKIHILCIPIIFFTYSFHYSEDPKPGNGHQEDWGEDGYSKCGKSGHCSLPAGHSCALVISQERTNHP